jgi:hypothetical protein
MRELRQCSGLRYSLDIIRSRACGRLAVRPYRLDVTSTLAPNAHRTGIEIEPLAERPVAICRSKRCMGDRRTARPPGNARSAGHGPLLDASSPPWPKSAPAAPGASGASGMRDNRVIFAIVGVLIVLAWIVAIFLGH